MSAVAYPYLIICTIPLMDLALITPLILTYNEEANIERTLQPAKLGEAHRGRR